MQNLANKYRSLPALARHAIVAAFFSIIIGLIMGPAVTDCNSTVDGYIGDSTSGMIWQNWIAGKENLGPFLGFSEYSNAPYGESLRNPAAVTSSAIVLPQWALSRVTSPMCAWNIMVFFGLLASAMITYAFMLWLIRSPLAAIFTAYAVTFSPYHMYKAAGHIGYIYSFVLTLVIWAFLNFWKQPTFKRALLLGAAFALPMYTDGYYVLLASVTFATLIVVSSIYSLVKERSLSKLLGTYFLRLAAAVAFSALLMTPIAIGYTTQGKNVEQGLSSVRDDINKEIFAFTARWRDYITPAPTHPVLGQLGKNKDLHRSNHAEQTLYVGIAVLALAVIGFIWLIRNRSRDGRLDNRLLAAIFGTVVVVSGLFSMQPYVTVAGHAIATPPQLIADITPLWRVYARFFLPLHIALTALAGIGFYALIYKRRASLRLGAFIAVMIIVAFEFLTMPPRPVWSYSDSPQVYKWLKDQQDIDTIVEYPLVSPPIQEAYDYFTFQQVHGKKMLNTSSASSPQNLLRSNLANLNDPQTARALKSLGIDAIVTDPAYGKVVAPGYRTLYEKDGYRVLKPVSDAPPQPILLAASGFSDQLLNKRTQQSYRYMGPEAILMVDNPTKDKRARLSFKTESLQPGLMLRITQNNKVLWHQDVSDVVEFEAETGSPIYISTNKETPLTLRASDFNASSD